MLLDTFLASPFASPLVEVEELSRESFARLLDGFPRPERPKKRRWTLLSSAMARKEGTFLRTNSFDTTHSSQTSVLHVRECNTIRPHEICLSRTGACMCQGNAPNMGQISITVQTNLAHVWVIPAQDLSCMSLHRTTRSSLTTHTPLIQVVSGQKHIKNRDFWTVQPP